MFGKIKLELGKILFQTDSVYLLTNGNIYDMKAIRNEDLFP